MRSVDCPSVEVVARSRSGETTDATSDALPRAATTIEPAAPEAHLRDASIRELEQTTDSLRLRETCFRSIVDRSPNAGVICDFSGQISYVNQTFLDYFVEAGANPSGASLSDFLPGELSSTLDALTRDVIEGARKVEREVEVPFSDGSTHLVRGTKFPVIDLDGRAIGLIQLITDITVEKEAEQQLRQAQKLDAIGQLTGGIAHDFNNLLMVIDGYARQALNRLGDTDAAEASIKEVLLGAERATTLTRQLLAFSRRQLMERRVFCIEENLQEIEGLLVRSIGELFDLAFDFPEHRLCIDTDPGEFTQAVVNLAVNARDAMPGGGAITVGFRERPMDDRFVEKFPDLRAARTVEVFVTDQGHGMDKETLRRVFEPFFTTKERGKGTGLGLAMVYGFAQQSGGAVDIVSAPGEGTTVSIVLPIADRLPDDATEEMDEAWLGQNETILLVEDDTKVLGLTRYCLEELGYKVLTAENGFDALEREEGHGGTIDLVLSDVIMPVMGGFQLADIMRAQRPDRKFLFMSGYPESETGKMADLPKNAQFLQKPLKIPRLAQAVRSALDHDEVRLGGSRAG